MRILLDTNAYTQLRRGHRSVADRVRSAREVLLSAVVLGEILYGFRHGSQQQQDEGRLRDFLARARVEVVPVTLTTADRFGRVCAQLRRSGKPIPTNDAWIAAHAMETGAELITYDDHFSAVDGLVWSLLSAGA